MKNLETLSGLAGFTRFKAFLATVAPRCALALVIFATAAGCARLPQPTTPDVPTVDHILLAVSNLKTSLAFYHDLLGLPIQSNDGHFAMLRAGNMRVALWDKRWDWEPPRTNGERPGLGMYPHLKVRNVSGVVNRAQRGGYKIVQEPRHYLWGTEAFVADPDGYVWALID